MAGLRDKIRAKTVGAEKVFQEQKITVDMGDGDPVDVIVRQPTVEERAAILDQAVSVDPKDPKNIKQDTAGLQVAAVLALACVPNEQGKAGEKAFEEGDRDSLRKQPAGGWFDDLSNAAIKMLKADLDDAKKG